MGYSSWGSDTCGYNQQLLEQEVCATLVRIQRIHADHGSWPNQERGFLEYASRAKYDATLIAMWRMYARLHNRLVDYSHTQAAVANKTGVPIIRPLFLIDPKAKAAWDNWWTFEYGPDILVSPIWEKGVREQSVYLAYR